MKVKIGLILLFLVILNTLGCAPAIKNLDSKGEAIICFGNSITKGIGANEGEDYPKALGKLIGKKIINAGVGGDTTGTALLRLERDVLGKSPSLVIIELGANDFFQEVPKEITLKNLEQIILKIQDKGAAVALCDTSFGPFFSGYRNDFRKLARKTNSICILRLLESVLDNPALKSDYIHPNRNGYQLIAQKIYKELKKYIKL